VTTVMASVTDCKGEVDSPDGRPRAQAHLQDLISQSIHSSPLLQWKVG